ncbi:unnamed protein product [Cladocopium goreaui]|uniref:Uncharacterized protein n=1 Tax=Cladocopium goreaui TaxID=2562237 RepID=A0A9P1CRZ8_9DINO|nr:unnamed protein product [Cladocopium goreaui]
MWNKSRLRAMGDHVAQRFRNGDEADTAEWLGVVELKVALLPEATELLKGAANREVRWGWVEGLFLRQIFGVPQRHVTGARAAQLGADGCAPWKTVLGCVGIDGSKAGMTLMNCFQAMAIRLLPKHFESLGDMTDVNDTEQVRWKGPSQRHEAFLAVMVAFQARALSSDVNGSVRDLLLEHSLLMQISGDRVVQRFRVMAMKHALQSFLELFASQRGVWIWVAQLPEATELLKGFCTVDVKDVQAPLTARPFPAADLRRATAARYRYAMTSRHPQCIGAWGACAAQLGADGCEVPPSTSNASAT